MAFASPFSLCLAPHWFGACGWPSTWAPSRASSPLSHPACGPRSVYGGRAALTVAFLPRRLPNEDSLCAAWLFFIMSHNKLGLHKGSLSPPHSSRQPGRMPPNTAPGTGPAGFLPCSRLHSQLRAPLLIRPAWSPAGF